MSARDNVVYHGLAGHFFLRGVAHGFKVRVIADLEERVRLEMEREHCDERTARETLKKDDFERRRWALALYGVDTVDPILYDMVLNVGNLTLDCAVEMISGAARSPCFATTAESQCKLDNLVLASRVRVAVVECAPDARVSADDGTAFIDVEAGPGDEVAVRRKVQALAAAVEGVTKVRVNVRPQGPP